MKQYPENKVGNAQNMWTVFQLVKTINSCVDMPDCLAYVLIPHIGSNYVENEIKESKKSN